MVSDGIDSLERDARFIKRSFIVRRRQYGIPQYISDVVFVLALIAYNGVAVYGELTTDFIDKGWVTNTKNSGVQVVYQVQPSKFFYDILPKVPKTKATGEQAPSLPSKPLFIFIRFEFIVFLSSVLISLICLAISRFISRLIKGY